MQKRPRLLDVVLVALLALLTIVLYRKITRLWWTYDDAYLLHVAVVHPAPDHFIGGSIWRSMPQQLFTPLLTASYDSELTLFGFDARDFYAVHLGELALAAIALYLLLRLWLDPLVAATAAALFIAGASSTNIATELMLMHYVIAVILGCASVGLFVIAVRRGSGFGVRASTGAPEARRPKTEHLAVFSALLYLLALLAKEIAAPILLILLLLPESSLRTRVRYAIPHAIAAVVYAFWRYAALGTLLGGYGWEIERRDILPLIGLTPVRTFADFMGPQRIAGALLLIVMAAVILFAARSRRFLLAAVAALALSIAPFLPVAKEMQTRFAFVPWLCWTVLFGAALMTIANTRLRAAAAVIALILVLVVNRQAWSAEYTKSLRMSDEARVFADLGANDLLRTPAIPPAAMTELQWLKQDEMHRPAGTGWFYDDIYLCANPVGGRRVFQYDAATHRVSEATERVKQEAPQLCAASANQAPLRVHFHHHDETLHWELGPYDDDGYSIVIAGGLQAFPVPRDGGYRLRGVPALPLRVKHTTRDGTATYSPEFVVDLSKESDVRWGRPPS